MTRLVLSRALLGAGLLGLSLASARLARADEIVYRDPATCAEKTAKGVEVTSETWTEIRYKEKSRGPELSVPTSLVVDIQHADTSPQVQSLLSAIADVERAPTIETVNTLHALSGGGFEQDLSTGAMVYKPFGESEGSKHRPPWPTEYAHFYYAKALYLVGTKTKDPELLKQAYLALVDQKVKGAGGKDVQTGGFLTRFEGGNSRWYAEATTIAAKCLIGLQRYDEATALFKQLEDKTLALDIGPEWAYEAKIGPAEIAEAQGNAQSAINAAIAATNFMQLMLKNEVRECVRRELGRYYSRARMRAASVMLREAERNKNPSQFADLRNFIQESTPEALRKQFSTFTPEQIDAIVQGAMDPYVQAVLKNGLGFAYLSEKRYDDAVLAFRAVAVKYFEEPEEHARALHYLAQAADEAAKAATRPEAKKLYEAWRDAARESLRKEHPGSPWVK